MIDLSTLGTLNLVSERRVLQPVLAQPKRLALLVYLVLAAPRGFQRRDRLLSLFWPELDEKHARSSLSQALSYLRRSLGEGVVLTRGGEEVGIDAAVIRCDVTAFEEALHRGERQHAVSLYAGPFLDGFFLSDVPEFERWVESERERLAQEYARALEELAVERESSGDVEGAIEWWRKLAAQDPFSSRGALRLIQALIAAGEPSAALRHGCAHQTLLTEELGVEADPEIHALVEQLRADSSAPAGRNRRPAPDASLSLPASDHPAPELLASAPEDPAPLADEERGTRRSPQLSRKRSTSMAVLVLAAVLVTTSVAVGFMVRGGSAMNPAWIPGSPANSTPDAVIDRSIAVLPFENLSASAENEYFSDGITEDILTNLSKIESLRVISRTTVMQYKGTRGGIPEIARQLGVAYVLEGSVRRAGDRVRITAQLINARTDEHLWAETYDREIRDIFEIQSEVARQIARALQTSLSAEERSRIASAPTANLAAYDYYLLGRDHLNRRTTESIRNAVGYFQQAIQSDPRFALAYAGLADTYVIHALWSLEPHFEAVPKAKQAALRALALDSASAEVHTSLAQVYVLEWDWRTAEQSFRRALTLNPNYVTARHWYGVFLMYMARYEEAIPMAESARDIDPLSIIVNADLGQVYLEARRYREAEAQFVRTLALEPRSRLAVNGLAQTYERTGRGEDALKLYARLQEIQGFPSFYLAAFHARQGRREEGRRLHAAALEHHQSHGLYVRPVQVARVLVALGEYDEALAWLDKGYAERDSFMVLLLDSPDFDVLRTDRRFADLTRRMNFPWPPRAR